MNRYDILRMAREAGWTEYSLQYPVEVQRLERFANLVAAAEREACADICEGHYATDMAARAIRARGAK
jgi:hypothetical protein